MKEIYIILAFHAHELLWDLPANLMGSLEEENPMRGTLLDENFIKKRKEQGRDVYTRGVQFGGALGTPVTVEYTNELLHQIRDVLPKTFAFLKKKYRSGCLYPLYGHAHHTHVSLLTIEEIAQEIEWNMQFLHSSMRVPYPRYKGLFSPEASYDMVKLEGAARANIDYVVFPHLSEEKAPFRITPGVDYTYRPFLLEAGGKTLLALPRNFPISQEIWRPITRMERDAVKNQGYRLGDYPVFKNEYVAGERESFPISYTEGVSLYRSILERELERCPHRGLLLYIQDLELMDFGDLALRIAETAWREILDGKNNARCLHFVNPDQYIEAVVRRDGATRLPRLSFHQVCWAPEIRPVLRADGHYPPLGVNGVGPYTLENTGLYRHPFAFWEHGKYFCSLWDTLVQACGIDAGRLPLDGETLSDTGYRLESLEKDSRAVLFRRLMKRACNWGWRPTEGRQKRPYLDGWFLGGALLEKLKQTTAPLLVHDPSLDPRDLVGLVETLCVYIDVRLGYLRYGLESDTAVSTPVYPEAGRAFLPGLQLDGLSHPLAEEFKTVLRWKVKAVRAAVEMYRIASTPAVTTIPALQRLLTFFREHCQAVFMATEHLQKIWGLAEDTDLMVDRMYDYLYRLYPPLFPEMLERIDSMDGTDCAAYFDAWRHEPALV